MEYESCWPYVWHARKIQDNSGPAWQFVERTNFVFDFVNEFGLQYKSEENIVEPSDGSWYRAQTFSQNQEQVQYCYAAAILGEFTAVWEPLTTCLPGRRGGPDFAPGQARIHEMGFALLANPGVPVVIYEMGPKGPCVVPTPPPA